MTKILEEILNISPDYQYKAINNKNFIQANWHRNKWEVLKEVITDCENSSVLDIGTGSGNFEYVFHNRVKNIVGIDYYKKATEFVKQMLYKKGICNVKIYELPAQDLKKLGTDEKFDFIVIVDVIEHLKNTDTTKLLKDIKPLLKIQGKVIVITPNYKSSWLLIEKFIDFLKVAPQMKDAQHINKFTYEKLVKDTEDLGYKTDLITTFNTFSYLIPNRSISKKLAIFEIHQRFKFGNLLLSIFRL